jgi:hypothetical protein
MDNSFSKRCRIRQQVAMAQVHCNNVHASKSKNQLIKFGIISLCFLAKLKAKNLKKESPFNTKRLRLS